MYLFLVIATFSDLLLYGLLKQLNVCEKNKNIKKLQMNLIKLDICNEV